MLKIRSTFLFLLILLLMHIAATAALTLTTGNTLAAVPILAIFGCYMVLPESLLLYLMVNFYEPDSKSVFLGFVGAFAVPGALAGALLVPKGIENPGLWYAAGAIGGVIAVFVSLSCIHVAKKNHLLEKRGIGVAH